MTKQAQFILDEITKRYDPTIASHIWFLTQRRMLDYSPDDFLREVITLYQIMDEEGFSHSERGAIFATLFEDVTGQSLSTQAWNEILDTPVYGTSSFSPEVREELWRNSSSPSYNPSVTELK